MREELQMVLANLWHRYRNNFSVRNSLLAVNYTKNNTEVISSNHNEPVPKKSIAFGMSALIVFVFIQTDVRELMSYFYTKVM